MASSFSTMMAVKLGTVGEYVYPWSKLLDPVVLESFCEPVGFRALLCYSLSNCFVSISTLSQYSELDCEEHKHEVGLFDKQ